MSGGSLRMPVVVRVSVGSKYGAQHSQDWTSLWHTFLGLNRFPATPYDAKGLMYSCSWGLIHKSFESQPNLRDARTVLPREVRLRTRTWCQSAYQTSSGLEAISRYYPLSATLYLVIQAADILKQKYGISCEVIDARCLVPFDTGCRLNLWARRGDWC